MDYLRNTKKTRVILGKLICLSTRGIHPSTKKLHPQGEIQRKCDKMFPWFRIHFYLFKVHFKQSFTISSVSANSFVPKHSYSCSIPSSANQSENKVHNPWQMIPHQNGKYLMHLFFCLLQPSELPSSKKFLFLCSLSRQIPFLIFLALHHQKEYLE